MASDARSDAGVSTVFSAKLSEIGAQTALDGAGSVAAAPSSAAQLRVIRRGRFRGLPNETDANGEVQLVMVGEEFWLRFFRLKVYNNPVRDTLYLYFFRHKKVPRTVVLGGETVLVRLSGTPHGGLEESMPDEIQMPLDNVRTKKGHPIDQSAFESMVIVRPGIKLSDGSVIPTVVHAFCEFEAVQLSNLAFNKTVQGAVSNVKEAQKILESGVQAFSLKGKSYTGVEQIAKESLGLLGKGPKDEIGFEEFKVTLGSLEINHTEARAYKWFVLGDVNRNGTMDLGELTFVLFVIANSKPSRLLRPRDVFLMFDIDSKPATEKDRTGTVDLIGFYECVRAFDSTVAQEKIEDVFKQEDKKHVHRLNYEQFLSSWVKLIAPRAELEKRGIAPKSIGVEVGAQTGSEEADEHVRHMLKQYLLETLRSEDAEEDQDLLAAVERAHHARGKVRAGREKGRRERVKKKAETDKAVRRQKALEERARRLAAIKADEEAAQRAKKESELHHRALTEKQEREKQELEQVRLAAAQAEADEKQKRRELALDRIHMQNKGLAYVPSTLWLDPESKKHLPFLITMDVSANKLARLPEKHLFQSTVQLRKFDCSGNKLKSIPDAISSCHELLVLRADDNHVEKLPDMSGLEQLQLLSMRSNCITHINAETIQLRNVKRVNLSLNPLIRIQGDAFSNMRSLVELNLNSCELEFLPKPIFQNMNALQKLSLSGNKLRELPDSLEALQALTQLDVSHNSLRLLPKGAGALKHLMHMDLGYNQLRELPEDLSGLQYLLDLNLEQNVLAALPESLGQLVSLQKLTLCRNRLPVLPDVLGRLEDLQLLDISHNLLTFFPSTVGGLIRVKHINAAHNNLGMGGVSCFPQSFASLQAVEWLDVSFNSIQLIAPQISGLAALVVANFSNNCLAELPAQLCILPKLRILDISFNQLVRLPVEFGLLRTLEAVDLSCNVLRALPDCVGSLTSLRHLHLFNNRLDKLPLAVAGLFRGLVTFDCARNPLQSLPSKFVAADVLGAGGLNLRFSRSTVAGKNILNEIRDGLQRDIEREQLEFDDSRFDKLETDRSHMRLEDERAKLWARAGTNARLINYCMPALWKPVDLAEGQGAFRSATEQFPKNIDEWWAERGEAEKSRRNKIKLARRRQRDSIREKLLQEAVEGPQHATLSELERTRMKVSVAIPSTQGQTHASAEIRSLEKRWRQEDDELRWTELDEKWTLKLHDRVCKQEQIRNSDQLESDRMKQERAREEFWQTKGVAAPVGGQVPSLRDMHKVPISEPREISAEGKTEQFTAAAKSSTHGAVPQAPTASGKSQEQLATQIPEEDHGLKQTGAIVVQNDSKTAQDAAGTIVTHERELEQLKSEAAQLTLQIQSYETLNAQCNGAKQSETPALLSEAAKREMATIESELQYGPPAPVVGAFRRKGDNGKKGGLTDKLMTPYDKGSRLHALALGKGRPGSLELSVRQTLISGQPMAAVVKTAHKNSRFNYQGTSMYTHHSDITKLAEKKASIAKATGKALGTPKFTGRFNLDVYEHFDQSGQRPLQTVHDLRRNNRGKVVGLSRFSCKDYPLYKDSVVTQLASIEGNTTGLEPSSIPTTLPSSKTGVDVDLQQQQGTRMEGQVSIVSKSQPRKGTRIADLPRRAKVHRYNMTKAMININPNRTIGGSAFNPEVARTKLAALHRKILAASSDGLLDDLDHVLGAMFDSKAQGGEKTGSEVEMLHAYVQKLEEDPNVSMDAPALQEVRQLLMECSAAGSSANGLIPDIQPRAWQPAGYRLSQRDAQKRITKAKQLIMAIKLGVNVNQDVNISSYEQTSPPSSLSGARDDAWEVERAELAAPSTSSALALSAAGEFGDKLSKNLWSSNPYVPQQGVGFGTADSSVLATTRMRGSGSESKSELSLLSQSKLAQGLIRPSLEVPQALLSKLGSSKEDRKRARRWQTSGQLGDHNAKPNMHERANLAQASNGYTPSDVADFFSVQSLLHEPCMAEWVSNGGLYLEGGLSMSHFVSAVRRRLEKQWDASFTEAVKRFFIDTRASGGEPVKLTFESDEIVQAKLMRAEHYHRLREVHHKRVVDKMDAMWNAKVDKYSVSPGMLRRRMVSQEGRAAAMKEFQHQSWLRQTRTESRAASTRQTQQMVGKYKDLKDSRRAEAARLVEDTARRAQKLDRKARDRETFKTLVAQGVVPSAQNPLFHHSSLTLAGGSEESVTGGFIEQDFDSHSEGGIYEGESRDLPQTDTQIHESAVAPDSLDAFAEKFLTSEEAALLAVSSPPAVRNTALHSASVEAIASVDFVPSSTVPHRKNSSAQVAGETLVRQGSLDWAADIAANSVSQLYASARRVFVEGKAPLERK